MDNNDSNIKSQQTGGLKLMTVFIAVLALHVVVIGGFTVYHLMSGGTTDTDLATTDKNHKSLTGSSTTDSTSTDATSTDKSAATTTPPEVTTIPATTISPTITPDVAAPTVATTPAPASKLTPSATTTPALGPVPTPLATPALTLVTPAPTPVPAPAPAPMTELSSPSAQTPTGPISPELAPPAEPTRVAPVAPLTTPAPASSLAGPVHMPPANSDASRVEHAHAHEQIYVVKITDSYKKIAHSHHVTVAQLKEANHIKGDVLHTGQKLFIPSEKSVAAEGAAISTLASGPAAQALSESPAAMTTGLTSSSTTVATTGLHHHLYTVVKGDTLRKIAHRFKTTTSAIMAENGITDPTKLSIGKKLRIPSEESRSARAVPVVPQPSQVQAKGNTSAPTAQMANFAQ